MGHYDDAYDRDYEEEHRRKMEARRRDIPLIIADLQEAASKLVRARYHVDFTSRIEDDIRFTILALKGQMEPAH